MPLIHKIPIFKYVKHFVKTRRIYTHLDSQILSGYAIKTKKEALLNTEQITLLFEYLCGVLEAGGEIKHLPEPYELVKANRKE